MGTAILRAELVGDQMASGLLLTGLGIVLTGLLLLALHSETYVDKIARSILSFPGHPATEKVLRDRRRSLRLALWGGLVLAVLMLVAGMVSVIRG
jgi:hypothetical protein